MPSCYADTTASTHRQPQLSSRVTPGHAAGAHHVELHAADEALPADLLDVRVAGQRLAQARAQALPARGHALQEAELGDDLRRAARARSAPPPPSRGAEAPRSPAQTARRPGAHAESVTA